MRVSYGRVAEYAHILLSNLRDRPDYSITLWALWCRRQEQHLADFSGTVTIMMGSAVRIAAVNRSDGVVHILHSVLVATTGHLEGQNQSLCCFLSWGACLPRIRVSNVAHAIFFYDQNDVVFEKLPYRSGLWLVGFGGQVEAMPLPEKYRWVLWLSVVGRRLAKTAGSGRRAEAGLESSQTQGYLYQLIIH